MGEAVNFCCPNCRFTGVEEIMADVVVSSPIDSIREDEILYGRPSNEGGHVDRYQCGRCGYVIVNHDSPHSEDGLDEHALIRAIKELNATTPTPNVPTISYNELVDRMSLQLRNLRNPEAIVDIWNEINAQQIEYVGDEMFAWKEKKGD